jgi:hypothetical protein
LPAEEAITDTPTTAATTAGAESGTGPQVAGRRRVPGQAWWKW